MTWFRVTILLGLLPALAFADVVRLKTSADTFGQGWMFLDRDGTCKVVTAGHVVRAPGGGLRPVLAIDARNREWSTGAPLVMSEAPDIAVLPVLSANAPEDCGPDRLSALSVARRLSEMVQGFIVTTGQSEIVQVPVTRRAALMEGGGEIFAVQPTRASDVVVKGWSGSPVRDGTGVLGIVFETDPRTNEAQAVRIDVVRRLLDGPTAQTPPRPSIARPATAVLTGTTLDPARGPDRVFESADAAWVVQPQRGIVTVVASFPAPVAISRVRLGALVNGNRIRGLDVATQATTDTIDWTDANSCDARGQDAVSCGFLRRTVQRVRMLIRTETAAPISLGGLVFE